MSSTVARRANHQNWFYGLTALLVVLGVAFPLYLTSQVAQQNLRNIRELACILVSQTPDDPAKPVIHDFRAKYHCPPFKASDVGHLPKPATVTRTRTVPKPGPTSTKVMVSPVPTTVPGEARTVAVPMPQQTVTRVVTRTRTVTRTVGPPPCLKNLSRPPCIVPAG